MLNFGSLFGGDYAITGGFFICSQLLALTWFYQDMATAEFAATITSILPQFNSLPSAIQPALTSILVALTLLSVFCLLLDLIGSLYVIWELRLFRAHLERNRTWLTEVVDLKFQEYGRDDFINILSGVPADSPVNAIFKGMVLWKRITWQRSFEAMKSYSLLSAFQRMEQLLISYALGTQSEARINWLQEKIRLCRISRSITTVLVITSLEFYIISVHNYNISRNVIGFFIPGLLSILALFMTSRAYSRFCKTLFATVYTQVRSEQEQREDQKVLELQT